MHATFNRGVSVYPTLGDRVRVASRLELEQTFYDDKRELRAGRFNSPGSLHRRHDPRRRSLGKHYAILGTTGTGKSCTTALILRSIQQSNPAAHILLLDPHNRYASSFGAWGEVISPRNMQLPYWLLPFEELIEVLIGNPQERKAEIEILQELIPLAKCRTIYDSMAQSLGRMFRVPVNSKPITILELTGLPTESVNVVVSVRCRMTFDFALWSEGQSR